MAERRKNKKKKEIDIKERDAKPTNDEYAIAKYLKAKLPEKKTTLLGHKVEYLIASRAVDCLMESPWAKENKSEVHFGNRETAVEFMEKLLIHKFFHRAKKIVVQKEVKKKKKDAEETTVESSKEKESKKSKGKTDSAEKSEEKSEEKKESTDVVEKKKEKKRIKLDMHLEQIFIDSNEPYVWIYDPIPMRTWIIGSLMVVGAVLVCLFPLWPQTIRHYIYYLSVAAAFFLAFIIGLAVLRFVVFILIWLLTFGRHHLWLLPNLTEDVGFFESFWPLYKYEYRGKDQKKENESPKEKKDKGEKEEEEEVEEDAKKKISQEKSDSNAEQEHKEDSQAQTESEHESEEEEEKVKDDNGFELVEAEEMEGSEEEDTDKAEDRKTK